MKTPPLQRHFPYQHPVFGTKHKPAPVSKWKNTVYFYWWAYGNRALKVRDEKSSIVIGDKDNLIPTLKLLKQAAEAGEFDTAIQSVQRPFGRPIPSAKSVEANKRGERQKKVAA